MDKEQKKTLTLLVALIVAGTLFTVGLDMIFNPEGYQRPTTKDYKNINVSQAMELIPDNNTHVVDVRGLEGCGQCQFNNGHLPKAFRYTDPTELYNLSNNLIIYSTDGVVGEEFCEQLTGHVYGMIYNLEGGWNAWSNYYVRQ